RGPCCERRQVRDANARQRALGHESLSLFGAGSVNSRRIVSCPPDSGRGAGMRVKGVTPFLVDLGGGKNLLFVKVETEGGPHGWGECYTQAHTHTRTVHHVEDT